MLWHSQIYVFRAEIALARAFIPGPPPLDLATIFFSGTCLMFYVCFVVFCMFCLFIFLPHTRVLVGTRASYLFFIIITIPRSLHLSEYECLTGF